jgi:hypothetical protein
MRRPRRKHRPRALETGTGSLKRDTATRSDCDPHTNPQPVGGGKIGHPFPRCRMQNTHPAARSRHAGSPAAPGQESSSYCPVNTTMRSAPPLEFAE